MHSTTFTQIAQAADERSQVVMSVVEDVRAMQEMDNEITLGAVILSNPDTGEFAFARFGVAGKDVAFTGEQHVGSNVSKAYKFLSDYTLDRRPMRHIESGAEVEQALEAILA